jgi:hypothetical protein
MVVRSRFNSRKARIMLSMIAGAMPLVAHRSAAGAAAQ